MKLLHINCNYMSSKLHQQMIDTLEEFELENHVFVPLYHKDGYVVEPKSYVDCAVCFRKWDRLFFHWKQRKIYQRIKKDFEVSQFTCLHAYTVFTDGNVTRKLAKEYHKSYVVAVRSTDVNVFFKYMPHLRSTGVRVLRDAKAVFFLSKAYQDHVMEHYVPAGLREEIAKKSYIIPNGIDDFWHKNIDWDRSNEKRLERFKNKEVHIIYAGGINKNKNVKEICDACNILKNEGYQTSITVVGKIRDKDYFESFKDQVNYFEQKPKEELITLYRDADIFVMPSHTETFGLVYAEAMSQGLPVIYTRGQGFDGQFKEGMVGYSVSDTDSQELARAIQKVVDSYQSISENARTLVRKFKWKDICASYLEIYSK